MGKVQKVKVALEISGDYVAFDEIMASVLYDYTNNKLISINYSFEEIEELLEEEYEDYSDCQKVDAILIDGKYYFSF